MATARKERGTRGNSGPVSPELIERAAIRLFSEKTYPVIGMRDISDAVGILPGSLYVHIASKEDVLLRIVTRGIQNYLDALESIAESDQPVAERLRAAIVAHMRVLAETQEQTRVAFHQWTYLGEENQQLVIKLRQQYEDLFSRMIQHGIESGEFRAVRSHRVAVLATIGMLNSAAEWFSPSGLLSAEEVGEALADSTILGLRA